MKFTLPLPTPTNNAYATSRGRWYKPPKIKAWEDEALWEIKKQWNTYGNQRMLGDVAVMIDWHIVRERDVDGAIKPILDIFERAGVYKNDSQVQMVIARKYKSKKAYCTVDIDDLY